MTMMVMRVPVVVALAVLLLRVTAHPDLPGIGV
ncbi:hypothetical protein FHU13_003083 [Methylobacterium sp. R2-1]|nr:hypothetical protein [Methylobacterium sp. R2-1]